MLLLSLALIAISCSYAAVSGDKSQYLYHGQMRQSEYSPVKEYIAPDAIMNGVIRTSEEESSLVLPKFLTKNEETNRVVEFYAHWCGHCQNYRWQYIDLARSCSSLAKSTYGIDVDFHAISCSPNRAICKSQNITRFPSLRIYAGKSEKGIQESVWNAHCFTFLKLFGIEMIEDATTTMTTTTDKMQQTTTNNRTSFDMLYDGSHYHDTRSRADILGDAFKSFDFAMRESIYYNNNDDGLPLKNKTHVVFRDWVLLLKQVLPPFWKIHNALDAIVENLPEVTTREKALIEIMDRVGPSSTAVAQWRGCSSSSLDNTNYANNGYTCGLWELFHILTIGVVEWNSAATLSKSVIPVNEVARRLANYIREFFAFCDVCRSNFLSKFENCSHLNRCNRLGDDSRTTTSEEEWKELALWLWEEHNEVNVRLAKERKEERAAVVVVEHTTTTTTKKQKEEIKLTNAEIEAAMWPSRYDCPRCWHTTKKNGNTNNWDKDHVYRYLRLTYWPVDDETNKQYAKTTTTLRGRNYYYYYYLPGSETVIRRLRDLLFGLAFCLMSLVAAWKFSFRLRRTCLLSVVVVSRKKKLMGNPYKK